MSTNGSVRKIVVGLDYTELGDAALRAAIALANAAGGTQVHAVHVRTGIEGLPISARTVEKIDADVEKLRQRVDAVLAKWREDHGEPKLPELAVHVTSGSAAAGVIRTAAALGAGLITVGTHGRRGLKRAILGSVAGDVVAKATCPVLVIRPIEHDVVESIADVEPPCPDCLARRAATEGLELWCERHAEHHPRAHVYSYSGPSSSPVRPWGF